MGKKDKQRNKLREFTRQKQLQQAKKNDMLEETRPLVAPSSAEPIEASLLLPIKPEILQDPSTDLPGFVAEEIGQQEEVANGYGSITDPHDGDNKSERPVSTAEEISGARLRVIMLSMYLGIFLAAIDNTIVSTTSAHVASEFNQLSKVSWIATSYLLSSATFQPLYGKVSDIFGREFRYHH